MKRLLIGAFFIYAASRLIGQFEYPAFGVLPLHLVWDLVIIFGLAALCFLSASTQAEHLVRKDYLLLIPIVACISHFLLYQSQMFSSDSLIKALISSGFLACVVTARRSRNTEWTKILNGLIVFLLIFGSPLSPSLGDLLGEKARTLFTFGAIGQKNIYATILASSVLLLAHLNRHQRSQALLVSLVLCLGSMVICFNGSRTGFIGLVLGLILLFLVNVTQGQVRAIAGNLLAIMAGIAAYFFLDYLLGGEFRVIDRISVIGTDNSTSYRLIFLSLVPEILANSPMLGFGPNSSHLAIQHSFIQHNVTGDFFIFNHPHNLIADTIIESGIMGFLLFFLPYLFWLLFAPNILALMTRLSVSFPLILHTQTEFPLEQSGLFLFLLALTVVLTDESPTPEPKRPRNVGRISIVGGALCLACLVAILELGYTRHTLQTKFQESASTRGQERITKLQSEYLSRHWYYGDFHRNRELLTIIDQKLISNEPRSACVHSNEMSRFTLAMPTAINYQVTSMLSEPCGDPLAKQLTRTYVQSKALGRNTTQNASNDSGASTQ